MAKFLKKMDFLIYCRKCLNEKGTCFHLNMRNMRAGRMVFIGGRQGGKTFFSIFSKKAIHLPEAVVSY